MLLLKYMLCLAFLDQPWIGDNWAWLLKQIQVLFSSDFLIPCYLYKLEVGQEPCFFLVVNWR